MVVRILRFTSNCSQHYHHSASSKILVKQSCKHPQPLHLGSRLALACIRRRYRLRRWQEQSTILQKTTMNNANNDNVNVEDDYKKNNNGNPLVSRRRFPDLFVISTVAILSSCFCHNSPSLIMTIPKAAAFAPTTATARTSRHRHHSDLYRYRRYCPQQPASPIPSYFKDSSYRSYHTRSNNFSAVSSSARRPTSVSLEMGRERRVSGKHHQQGEVPTKNKDQQAQRLIEKEESARRERIEQMKQRLRKAARREDRILFLEAKISLEEQEFSSNSNNPTTETVITEDNNNDDSTVSSETARVTDAERAELEGLLRFRENFEEQYDASGFSDDHLKFKDLHNDAFLQLVRYCERNRRNRDNDDNNNKAATTNVFFLDGPDGRTASALIRDGNMDASQCYVANRHESTCVSLRQSGGGLLPEGNVVHATASEALSKQASSSSNANANDNASEEGDDSDDPKSQQQGAFAHLDFTGYYFDGCNGFAPHIVNMMSSTLLQLDHDNENQPLQRQRQSQQHPIAVGYSLIGGGSKKQATMVEKELTVSRALTTIAKTRGMRVVQALDDPTRYGLDPETPKVVGNTFTTWLILEPDGREKGTKIQCNRADNWLTDE
mmetsp:Transcript_8566/g.18698  ORF Transcript_8566/g.18698 Transcript_8566/m.18698 type:complete len:609 (-) Transcript_8566:1131-2957(-)